MITRAPSDDARAAATRGPAANTSLPRGSSSATNDPVIGAASTTPTPNAHATTVTAAMRSARRRGTSRYTVPRARIGTLASAPRA